MPFNPDLIKPDVDNEEYEIACPTLGASVVTGLSTPVLANHPVYRADCEFFVAHPSRRFNLRPQYRDELDEFKSEEDFKERPMLWVLVWHILPDIHLRIPLWRGRSFWNEAKADSDEAVNAIVLETCLQGGMNLCEWMSFIYDQRAHKADESKKRSKKMVN